MESAPEHTRVMPSYSRLGRRVGDVRVVERAHASILDLSASLDRRLLAEGSPAERLRLLRETTNQITRTANDAIQAYRRASAAVDVELQIARGDAQLARKMRQRLGRARGDLLGVLEVASRRYEWAEPWPPLKSSVQAGGR